MRVLVALSILSVAATACHEFDLGPRPTPPPPVLEALGEECAGASECASNFCVDALCCEAACAASQTCARVGSLGHCTDRQLGEPCTADAMCPSGYCSDGVCCSSRCTDKFCYTCADDQGECRLADDNSDTRKKCGKCEACYGGVCAPATPGSDPGLKCDSGLVCGSSGGCGVAAGAFCDDGATATVTCAVGECVTGECMSSVELQVELLPMNPNATERNLMSLAGSSEGDVAVLFAEDAYTTDASGAPDSYEENSLMLATRKKGGDWIVQEVFADRTMQFSNPLDDPTLAYLPSSVTFFADMVCVASYNYVQNAAKVCDAPTYLPCGLFGMFITLDGALGAVENIDDTVRRVVWTSFVQEGGGALGIAYAGIPSGSSETELMLSSRDPISGQWSTPTVLDVPPDVIRPAFVDGFAPGWTPEWTPAVVALESGPVVFYRNADKQLMVWSGGPAQLINNLPIPPGSTSGRPCGISGPMQAVRFTEGANEAIRFYGWCLDPDTGAAPISIVGTWRPALDPTQQFTVETPVGQYWETAADDPEFFTALTPQDLPMLFVESPPPNLDAIPASNSDVRLVWDDEAGFHQEQVYFPPADSVIRSVGGVTVGKTRPLFALTLEPNPLFSSFATGPALVVVEYR